MCTVIFILVWRGYCRYKCKNIKHSRHPYYYLKKQAADFLYLHNLLQTSHLLGTVLCKQTFQSQCVYILICWKILVVALTPDHELIKTPVFTGQTTQRTYSKFCVSELHICFCHWPSLKQTSHYFNLHFSKYWTISKSLHTLLLCCS
jgi:hypothetical protein